MSQIFGKLPPATPGPDWVTPILMNDLTPFTHQLQVKIYPETRHQRRARERKEK